MCTHIRWVFEQRYRNYNKELNGNDKNKKH